MPHPHAPDNSKAIAWALLSQALWLPLLAIDAHDRWQAEVRRHSPSTPGTFEPIAKSGGALPEAVKAPSGTSQEPHSTTFHSTTGLVLGAGSLARDSILNDPLVRTIESPASASRALLGSYTRPPISIHPRQVHTPGILAPAERQVAISVPFTKAEILGGPISLADPTTPLMPPLALAEKARWARLGDPLSPLPDPWKEPMRMALKRLPANGASAPLLQTARVIHIPSTRVHKPVEVPLAIQSDGSVDILSNPRDPAVIEDIRVWSHRQANPRPGTLTPAVVHLHPIPEAEVVNGPAAANPVVSVNSSPSGARLKAAPSQLSPMTRSEPDPASPPGPASSSSNQAPPARSTAVQPSPPPTWEPASATPATQAQVTPAAQDVIPAPSTAPTPESPALP